MTEPGWTPFGLTDDERAQYDVLVDGLPKWILDPVLVWLTDYFTARSGWVDQDLALTAQLVTRINLGIHAGAMVQTPTFRATLKQLDDGLKLRLVDYVLSNTSNISFINELSRILRDGRSKWQVAARLGKPGLAERVPAGVQSFVEATIASAGAAGAMLERAWTNLHGVVPNDSVAYGDAVRAVEIAAITVVQPAHSTATLGTVLGQMRADGDWRLPLREHEDAPSTELVLAMARTLWYGHRDRHGSVDYSDVTHEEARAAVACAAALVDWFASGALQRRAPIAN